MIKTLVCIFLLLAVCGCRPNSEVQKEKIKSVLDNFDQITKDFESNMKSYMQQAGKDVSFKKIMDDTKNMCGKLDKIDTSETPSDFQTTFKKLNSTQCDNLNSPEDFVASDSKTKAYNNAMRELEEVSAKYGYVYKYSTPPK